MRIIEIQKDRLYRINCKDVWIKNGEIQTPKNENDILTDAERKEIQMKIF